MNTILKLLALPTIFILPWFLMKANNSESLVQKSLTEQPLLLIILLLPGFIVFIGWFMKQLKR